MDKPYYVTLTGGKNNAGDFLIKYRAFNLFKIFRRDRDIIDYNEWEKIDDEKLKVINGAKALILLGGPGIVYNMYPNGAYKLRDNLNDIIIPVVMMGLGWKDSQGDWEDTYQYKLSFDSMKLLKKIENSGYLSSVRDYHTLNLLQLKGFKNFLMTGCPAYYDQKYINNRKYNFSTIEKIAFSLGVSFVQSRSMEKQMKNLILKLYKIYSQNLEIVFHHSLDENTINLVYGQASLNHYKKHKEFSLWLDSQGINFVDISGNAKNLIDYYSKVDLHIGYRVHAHIFMNSIDKYSILLNEDGRGKGVDKVLGGTTINAYNKYRRDFPSRVLSRLFQSYDRIESNQYIEEELFNILQYNNKTHNQVIQRAGKLIDSNFTIMKNFIKQLP